ncbi:OmpA/MotB domain protein, partial [Actinobacteria bacterium OK006]
PDGTTRNYSSRNPEEYFAQTVNAYLGTNHGTDPFTTRPRNNGAAWVRDNEPVLLPILERLHGIDPAPVPHPNPVALTTAENTLWQGYRDFTTLTTPTLSPADGNASATAQPAHEDNLSEEVANEVAVGDLAVVGLGRVTGSGEVSTERWRPLTDGSGHEPFLLSEENGQRRVVAPESSSERTLVGYAWTWHEGVEGRPPVVVMTRRLFLSAAEGAGEAELERVRQLVPQALDELVNARGYRLPVWPDRLRAQWDEEFQDPAEAERDTETGQPVPERPLRFQSEQDMVDGPLLRLRVEFVDDPDMAHEEPIKVRPGERGVGQVMDQGVWFAGEENPVAYVHELLHGFGVADDLRTDGETHPGTSLMGHRWGSDLALTTEHLRQIAEVYAPSAHPTSHSAPELTWHGPMKRRPADVAPAVDYSLIHPDDKPSWLNRTRRVVESREEETLWRISDMPPEKVFTEGFFAKIVERVLTVAGHVVMGPNDQFVSATRSSVLGHITGMPYKRWRYEIHPWLNFDKTGVDVNATLASQNALDERHSKEMEVAFTRRIDPAAIVRVRDRETGKTGVWDATIGEVVWSEPSNEIVVLFGEGDKELTQPAKVAIDDLALWLVVVARQNPEIARTTVTVTGFGNGGRRSGAIKARNTGLSRAKAVTKFLTKRIEENLRVAKELKPSVLEGYDRVTADFWVIPDSGGFTVDPALNSVADTRPEQLRSALIRFEHHFWTESGTQGEPPAVGVVEPQEVGAPGLGVDWFTPLPESDAVDAATGLIVVPEGVERPVAAHMQLTRLLSGMLTDPDTADRVQDSGVRVVVIPRDVPITHLVNATDLTHAAHEIPDGVSDARVTGLPRGLTLPQAKLVLVSEENLLGEHTTTDPNQPFQAGGYSSVTHELAHMIYHFGLTDHERQTVREAFTTKTAADDGTQWADGPLTGPDGTTRNYSSRNPEEYFAQTTNTYLGTNHGTDPFTTRPRNNGAAWVRDNEPVLLPILERLHGTDPAPVPHPNPVALTTAENTHWQGYRDFTTLTGPPTAPTPSPADGDTRTTPARATDRPAHEETPSPAAGPAVSDRAVATALASYAAALTTLEHARTTHHTAKQRDINHGEGSSTHVTDPTDTHTALTRAHAAVTHAETVLNSLGVNLEDLRINDDDLRTRPRLPGGSHYTFKEATDNPHDDTDSDADAGDAFDPLFDDAEIDDTDSDAAVDNRGEAGTGRPVPASRPGLALPSGSTSGPVAPVRPGPSPLTRSGPPNTAADRGTEGTDQTTPASEEPAIAAIQASIDTYRNGPWLNLTPAQGPVLWGDVEHPDPHPSWAAPNEGRTLTPRQRVTLFTALVRLNTPAPLDAVHQHITATHHLTLTPAALHRLHHQYFHWRENEYHPPLHGEIDGWSHENILTAYTQHQQKTGGKEPRPPKKLTWSLNGHDLPLGQIMRKIHTEPPRDENRRHLINHLRKQGATHLSLPLRAEFSDEEFLGAITKFKNGTKWDGGKLNQGQTQLFNGKIIPIGRLLYNYRNRIAMVAPTLLQGMKEIGIQDLDEVRIKTGKASPQIITDEEFLGGLMAHKNETKWDGGKLNQRQTQLFNGKIIRIGRLYYIRNGKVMASAALLQGMKDIGIQDLDRAKIKPERATHRKITDEKFLGGLMAHKNETKWDGGKLKQGQTQLFNGEIIPIAEHLYNIQHGRTMVSRALLQGMKEIGVQNLDKVRIKTGKDYRQNIADSLGIIAATAPTTKTATAPTTKTKGNKRSAAEGLTGRSGPPPAKRPKGTGAGTSTAASAGVVPVPSAEVRSPAPAPRPSDGTLPSTRTVGPDVLGEVPDAPGSSAHPGTESTGPTFWDDILGGATFSSHPNMDLTGANDPSGIPDWTGLPLPGTESTGPTLWDDILGGATFSSHPN